MFRFNVDNNSAKIYHTHRLYAISLKEVDKILQCSFRVVAWRFDAGGVRNRPPATVSV